MNPQAKLERLYAEVPELECKGLCGFDCCGPVPMQRAERERIEAQTGEPYELHFTCPLLDFAGRCTVYPLRPLICRLWGAVEGMECHHGCRPERYLTDAEARELIARATAISETVLP